MARLTKKSYKRRRIVIGAAIFMSIALVSSGFATWVISSQSKDSGTGDVTVGTISDKSVKVTIDNKDKLGTFAFDSDPNDKTGRVRYDSTGNAESLSVTVTGKVSNPDFLGSLKIRLVELGADGKTEVANASETKMQKAIDADYVVAPTCFYNDVEIFDSKADGYESSNFSTSTGTFSYTITFKWGSAFKATNPSVYYDTEYSDSTTAAPLGKDIDDTTMINTLLNLRDTITGTTSSYDPETSTLVQDTNVVGTQYKVIVTATSN